MIGIKVRKNDIREKGVRVRSVSDMERVRLLQQTGIICCGIDDRPPAHAWGDPLGRSHLLFFVIQGDVVYEAGDTTIPFRAGEYLIIPAGASRWFRTRRASATLVWFHFYSGVMWDALIGEAFLPHPARHLSILYAAVEVLLEESVSSHPDARDAGDQLSGLILHYLRRELLPQESPVASDVHRRLADVWTRLAGALATPWSVPDMAGLAHMSEGHFIRQVRSHYMVTPMEMLARLRMERAAMLLKTTSRTLEDLAGEVGYGSAHAFSDAFLRHMGCRPGGFRRKSHRQPSK